MQKQSLGLSVIVPLLDEIQTLPSLVSDLDKIGAEQLIIVDGGSRDGSYEWLEQHWQGSSKHLLKSLVGRARQMNAGAKLATQPMLLFLHADTQLPSGAKDLVCRFATTQNWGRFDVRFASTRKPMRLVAFFMNLRSRITRVATGDQALFMHRELFSAVNGFDDLALMEDVAMSKKLRKHCPPRSLRQTVTTSARRWEQSGIAATVLKMWWYRLLYFCGASPDWLARNYSNIR